jgi:hypothetical protein
MVPGKTEQAQSSSFSSFLLRSTINTWYEDWGIIGNTAPNRLKADQYLANDVPIEEWEDELLNEWLSKRKYSVDDGPEGLVT